MENFNLESIHIMSKGWGSLPLFTSAVGVSLSDDDWTYEYSRISSEGILLIPFSFKNSSVWFCPRSRG